MILKRLKEILGEFKGSIKCQKNLKQRISTSFGLIGLLIMMFLFDFALYYIIILVGILSVLEFIKVILIIFKKGKI